MYFHITGAIFTNTNEDIQTAFKYAIHLHNTNDSFARFKVEAVVDVVDSDDPFKVSRACESIHYWVLAFKLTLNVMPDMSRGEPVIPYNRFKSDNRFRIKTHCSIYIEFIWHHLWIASKINIRKSNFLSMIFKISIINTIL